MMLAEHAPRKSLELSNVRNREKFPARRREFPHASPVPARNLGDLRSESVFRIWRTKCRKVGSFNDWCAGSVKRFSDHVNFARSRIKTRRRMVQRVKPNDLRTYFDPGTVGYSAASAQMRGPSPFRVCLKISNSAL